MIGDPRSPAAADDLSRFAVELRDIREQLKTLQAPTGSQLAQTVVQLQQLVANINTTLNNYINNYSYTRAQIDARVLDPAQSGGNVSTSANISTTGAISAGGNISAGTMVASQGTFNGGLKSTDVYNHLVNYGSYRATWTNSDGTIGYAPSSRRFKQDITDWALDASVLAQLRPVLYRYIEDVQLNGVNAHIRAGLIAEEVDALGLKELVDYDDQGQPFGVNYALVAVGLIKLVQMRNMQRSHQTVTQTLGAVTLLQATTTVDIVWPVPMADADYTVVCGITAPGGILSSAIAYLVPGTRTAKGCTVAVRAIGVALGAGQTLTVEGLHL